MNFTEFIVWFFFGVIFTLIPVFARKLSRIRHRKIAPNTVHATRSSASSMLKVPAFKASRLTPTTFLVIEHSDSYDEHPYIYVKFLTDSTLLILDTGCGGKTDNPEVSLTSLREFIETVGIEDNGGNPLNEGGRKGYILVLSHCHYDHICALN